MSIEVLIQVEVRTPREEITEIEAAFRAVGIKANVESSSYWFESGDNFGTMPWSIEIHTPLNVLISDFLAAASTAMGVTPGEKSTQILLMAGRLLKKACELTYEARKNSSRPEGIILCTRSNPWIAIKPSLPYEAYLALLDLEEVSDPNTPTLAYDLKKIQVDKGASRGVGHAGRVFRQTGQPTTALL